MQGSGGVSAGAGGVNDSTRLSGGGGAGLARCRSAPATWLDALLNDDDDDSLKPFGPQHQGGLTHLVTGGTLSGDPGPSGRTPSPYIQQPSPDPGFLEGPGTAASATATSGSGFHRMNSSPAEFLSGNVEEYFSSFGIPSSYEYAGTSSRVSSSGERLRDADSDKPSPSFASHKRGEQSGQVSAASSLLDMEMERSFEDSVPCRVRAQRGCATHPRSIAERVRRTKISDRIRKLQELVPNMDKQSNTADMLEEAVEYVKSLQKQIQELTEQQKNCECMMTS